MNLALIPAAVAAQTAADNVQAASPISTILFAIGFMLIFYFMLWRPQSKRAKEHQQLISNLKIDDEIVTTGGLIGKIVKIKEQFIVLEVAEKINIHIQKQAISAMVPKGTIKSVQD